MATTTLHLAGMVPVGAEGMCIAYQPEGQSKIIPIWAQGPDVDVAYAVVNDVDDGKKRPLYSLIDLFSELGGVATLRLSSVSEGVFVFEAIAHSSHSVEVTASTAVVLSREFRVDPVVEDEVAAECAVFVSPEDLKEYLGLALVTPVDEDKNSAVSSLENRPDGGVDPQLDADFEAMMRDLGMDDIDLDDGGSQDLRE